MANITKFKDGSEIVTYHESLGKANLEALENMKDPNVLKVITRQLTETEDKYRLCPCGSGKKHKFCCLGKIR